MSIVKSVAIISKNKHKKIKQKSKNLNFEKVSKRQSVVAADRDRKIRDTKKIIIISVKKVEN